MNVCGRNREIKILGDFYHSSSAEFLALYGRRRVGKTYLIKEFFGAKKEALFFNVTGAKKAPLPEQISHFTLQLSATFYHGANIAAESTWDKAFAVLTKAMVDQVPVGKKIVLFFDELPWMATSRSRLLETLDYYWNQHWSGNKNIKLIICGSAASWIINKIIHNKGGLHNRVTREMLLEPFNLSQTKDFLYQRKLKLNERQILELYLVTGGVPFYLTKIEKGLSASQITEALAFTKKGFFLEEFDKLFASLFNESEDYIKIVKFLAASRYGIGERRLLEKLGKEAVGGKGKRILHELEQSGFIVGFKPLYHKRKGVYYRLIDEYTLFYLKWIEPIKATLAKQSLEPGYWQSLQTTPEWYSWQGYAFEAVCYKHIAHIKKALKLSPTALPGTWRYVPHGSKKECGAQIDLLFDRKDNAITICEIKYSKEPYVLTKDYVESMKSKMVVFQKQTKTKKQLFLAMITASGLKNNYYAEDLCSGVVTLDDLFIALA